MLCFLTECNFFLFCFVFLLSYKKHPATTLQLHHNLFITCLGSQLPTLTFFFRCDRRDLCNRGHKYCWRNETSIETLEKQQETRKMAQRDSAAVGITAPQSSTFCSWFTGFQQFHVKLQSAPFTPEDVPQSYLHPHLLSKDHASQTASPEIQEIAAG